MKKLAAFSLLLIIVFSSMFPGHTIVAASPVSDHILDFSKSDTLTGLSTTSFTYLRTTEQDISCTKLTAKTANPYVTLSSMDKLGGSFSGTEYQWVVFSVKNESIADHFEFLFGVNGTGILPAQTVLVPMDAQSTEWKTYIAHVPTANLYGGMKVNRSPYRDSEWLKGDITTFRLDAMFKNEGVDGALTSVQNGAIYIEYIAFYKTAAEAANAAGSGAVLAVDEDMPNLMTQSNPPAIIDFSSEDTINHFHSASNVTYTYDTESSSLKWVSKANDPRAYFRLHKLIERPINVNTYQWMAVTIMNTSTVSEFEFYMILNGADTAVGNRAVFPIESGSSEWKTYWVKIADANNAGVASPATPLINNGYLQYFRIDAFSNPPNVTAGQTMYIKTIGFYADAPQSTENALTFTYPDSVVPSASSYVSVDGITKPAVFDDTNSVFTLDASAITSAASTVQLFVPAETASADDYNCYTYFVGEYQDRYLVTPQPALDGLLGYEGFAIRTNNSLGRGLRYKSSISEAIRDDIGDDFAILEYGLLAKRTDNTQPLCYITQENDAALRIGKGVAFDPDNAVNREFAIVNGRIQFTSVLIGISEANTVTEYAFRSYCRIEYFGTVYTLYGNEVSRSIRQIAQQITTEDPNYLNTLSSDEQQYIRDLLPPA